MPSLAQSLTAGPGYPGCPQGTQHPELEDRDGEQKKTSTIQEKNGQ